jgi:hypothetical protein
MEINYTMKDREYAEAMWMLMRKAYDAVEGLPKETPKETKQLLWNALNEGYILAQDLLRKTEDLVC